MTNFKPILAPNDQPDLSKLNYPLLSSKKLDGIRCIFYKGQILSRSLKQIQNKQLRERFEPIRKYSEECNLIFDGEIYSPELTFQEITHYVMTQDLNTPKVGKSKGIEHLPEHLKFYCFDCVVNDDYDMEFSKRYNGLNLFEFPYFVKLHHEMVENQQQVETLFEISLLGDCEGLILRDPNGRYKFGRGTLKEGIIFKVKPFETFDAQIIGVVQSTEVREGAEKKTNELGRSVTSKKKEDRILIEKASAFWVKYEDHDLKVVLAMTDEEKEEVWLNKDDYLGKTIEYKGMVIGSKDVPRHPVFIRFREDK